jgi:hypothetical protein
MPGLDVGSVIKGVGGIIDQFVTNPKERAEAKAALMRVENDLTASVLDYEGKIALAQRDVVLAEAQSASWMARNWRPLLMLTITFVLAHKYILFPYLSRWLDVPDLVLPPELFTLLTVGVGGYVVGRSGEKIAKTMKTTKSENAVLVDETKVQAKQVRKIMKLAKKQHWTQEMIDERLKAMGL